MSVKEIWNSKQKRAFHCLKNGIRIAGRFHKFVRFLTLTTSQTQFDEMGYDNEKDLNYHFIKFRQIVRHTRIIDLIDIGYIAVEDCRKYYPDKDLGDVLDFEYFRIRTDEGNGVLHILYKGDYLPYNFVVDLWNDLHMSFDVNIRLVDTSSKSALKTSCYLVSQYLGCQDSSFQRSSMSFGWIIRGYFKKYYEFIGRCRVRYFYNPIMRRYFKNRVEVNVFEEWYRCLVMLLSPKQLFLFPISD